MPRYLDREDFAELVPILHPFADLMMSKFEPELTPKCQPRSSPQVEMSTHDRRGSAYGSGRIVRHRLTGYLAHGVPSLFLANSFRNCQTLSSSETYVPLED